MKITIVIFSNFFIEMHAGPGASPSRTITMHMVNEDIQSDLALRKINIIRKWNQIHC
jgi:hypothetical protein